MAAAIAVVEVDSPPGEESTVQSEPVQSEPVQSEPVLTLAPADIPNVEHLVTEDDTPVDNWFSEKQQRLLTRSLYASWQGPGDDRPFLVAANVGVFYTAQESPLVPDVFLSLDARPPADWWAKPGRSYFIWEYGKPPDVVIEVVSNTRGGETDTKVVRYAQFGIPYYVIFDPEQQAQEGMLRAYGLAEHVYVERSADILPNIGLGLQLWQGVFEGQEDIWLRWYDASGALILTGAERAEQEKDRAKQAESRAKQAESRAEQLAALLRAHGIPLENNDL